MFAGIDKFNDGRIYAVLCLFLIGLASAYVWTGNTIILQNKTAEHLRSRVLGNSFMMTRAIGALAVVVVGFVVEQADFAIGMGLVAVLVTFAVPFLLRIGRRATDHAN